MKGKVATKKAAPAKAPAERKRTRAAPAPAPPAARTETRAAGPAARTGAATRRGAVAARSEADDEDLLRGPIEEHDTDASSSGDEDSGAEEAPAARGAAGGADDDSDGEGDEEDGDGSGDGSDDGSDEAGDSDEDDEGDDDSSDAGDEDSELLEESDLESSDEEGGAGPATRAPAKAQPQIAQAFRSGELLPGLRRGADGQVFVVDQELYDAAVREEASKTLPVDPVRTALLNTDDISSDEEVRCSPARRRAGAHPARTRTCAGGRQRGGQRAAVVVRRPGAPGVRHGGAQGAAQERRARQAGRRGGREGRP